MSDEPETQELPLAVEALKRIDRICLEFEAEWKSGSPPTIEAHLGQVQGTERSRLFCELLVLDLDYRRRKGGQPTPREYQTRFPQHGNLVKEVFAGKFKRLATGASAAPPPGTRIRYLGDYTLLKELGRGGMGVVYKARQRSLKRIVALKLMLAGQLASREEVERFHREAEAAANLQHPNIVAIHEVGEHRRLRYFSMDYVQGKSLREMVRERPMPAQQAARYLGIIADAIHYAHKQGTLHRDLKPANVLIDENDQPRITDFGLAKRVEADSQPSGTGQVLGTPGYMPPEQAAGNQDQVGPASDIYSLGAILYELLTGRPPFRAETPTETLLQVLHTEPVPPRLLNPKLPRDLETICLKCLEKEPQKRYGSARDLSDDLDRFLGGEAILARPVGNAERIWRWTSRKRRTLAAALAAAVVAVLLVVGVIAAWNHQRRAAVEAVACEFLDAAKSDDRAAIDGLLTEQARRNYPVGELGPVEMLVQTPDATYQVGTPTVSGDEAQVPVTVVNEGQQHQVHLRLRRESGAWRIYAMHSVDKGLKLTMDLERPIMGDLFSGAPEKPQPLQSMDLDEFNASWKVSLDVRQEPAGDVLRRLAEELGLSLAHAGDLQAELAKLVTIELDGCSRLAAIEEVCRQAGLHPQYSRMTLNLEKGPRRWPAIFTGPFLVEVEDVTQFAASATGLLTLKIRAYGLPEAIVDRFHGDFQRIKIDEVVDAEGGDLHDPDGPIGSRDAFLIPESYIDYPKIIPLKGLVRRVTAVSSLRGSISLSLPTRVESLRFEDPQSGISRRVGHAEVTLQRIGQGEPCALSFDFKHTDYGDVQIIPYDADGQLLETLDSFSGGSDEGGQAQISVPKRPASVTVSFIAAVEKLEHEFHFEDIPLPAHVSMPEKTAPATFPGHDAPVTFEFVRIVRDDPDFPETRLRVVNHSDKAVRKVEMRLTYLDANGKALDDWPRIVTPEMEETTIVAANAAADINVNTYLMPERTRRVAATAQSVIFADATRWKAQ